MIFFLKLNWVYMLLDCGVFNVANLETLGITVTKGTMMAHLNKTNNLKGRISMVEVIIGDLLLKDKLVNS